METLQEQAVQLQISVTKEQTTALEKKYKEAVKI